MLASFGSAGVEPLRKLTKCADSAVAGYAENALGGQFGYNNGFLFQIDEKSGEITLGEDSCGLYDNIVLNRVKKDSAAYIQIVNKVNPKPLDCYVFVSSGRTFTRIENEFYSAVDSEEVFEPYKLYKMPVSPKYETISLYTEYDCGNNECYGEQKDCKTGGVIEIGEDKDGNIVYQSYGEPGIRLEDAEKIMQKIKVPNSNK